MQPELRSLNTISLTEIAAVFNEAFSDYIVPLKLTEETLAAKIRSENIQLDKSVAVFDAGKAVAFILTGIDIIHGATIAYNAGTGVIPAYRGNKFGLKMYRYLLPLLKENGITDHQLEVITTNSIALKLYQQVGFKIARKLCCFKGNCKILMGVNKEIIITTENAGIMNNGFWNSQPSYQHSIPSIEREKESYVFLSATYKGNVAGYLVCAPANGRVKQFGVDKQYRKKGIGSALFAYALQQMAGKEIYVINIDAADNKTIGFLQNTGLSIFLEQYEMIVSYQ